MSNEVRSVSETGGEKGVKLERYDLLPVDALAKVAQLYGRGAAKYAEHNWRRGYEWSKSYAAMQRHATQFWGGEDFDEEMQLPHLAAVVFHALTLMTFMEEQSHFDDRYSTEQKRLAIKQEVVPDHPVLDNGLADLRARLTGTSEHNVLDEMMKKNDTAIVKEPIKGPMF